MAVAEEGWQQRWEGWEGRVVEEEVVVEVEEAVMVFMAVAVAAAVVECSQLSQHSLLGEQQVEAGRHHNPCYSRLVPPYTAF